MTDLTGLEQAVLKMLLEGQDEIRSVLRQQLQGLAISSREFSGVGFFSYLAVDSQAPRLVEKSRLTFGNVVGTAENLEHGFGLVLFVENGVLDMLEGYSHAEPWPDELRGVQLSYWDKGAQ